MGQNRYESANLRFRYSLFHGNITTNMADKSHENLENMDQNESQELVEVGVTNVNPIRIFPDSWPDYRGVNWNRELPTMNAASSFCRLSHIAANRLTVRSDCSIGRSCLIKRYCLIRRAHIAQLSDNTPHHCFKLENGKCRFSSEFFSEISRTL